jgi:hypothetical protein
MPSSIREALNELPITLDDTYERALQGIPKEKRQHAHRLFQCLVVAIRPLRVEELAEIFAVDFEQDKSCNLMEGWRPENPEEAVLSTCSTLISVIEHRREDDEDDHEDDKDGHEHDKDCLEDKDNRESDEDNHEDDTDEHERDEDYLEDKDDREDDEDDHKDDDYEKNVSRIVQFSHFSVKEFLTSDRLRTSEVESIRDYHVLLDVAHTVLARACLAVVLQLDENVDKMHLEAFPLVSYAAEHWVEHAKYEDVASRVQGFMEELFNPKKRHLAAWISIHDAARVWYERPIGYFAFAQLPPGGASLF